MSTFERVKKWLARSLAIGEESITPQSTLGDLYRHRPRTVSPEDERTSSARLPGGRNPDSLDLVELILVFEEEFDLEFPEVDAEALAELQLDQDTTVQQIVDLIDRSTRE
jgi:acyl carrier protein